MSPIPFQFPEFFEFEMYVYFSDIFIQDKSLEQETCADARVSIKHVLGSLTSLM